MAEPIRAHLDTPIASIQIGSRIRPVSEATISALDHVIGEYGFTVPILVRKARNGLWLIDGANRLETMRRRGETTIPAVHMECTDDEAAALESSQNIAGAGMSPLDDALFLAAYAKAYEKLHPETKHGMAGAAVKHGFATELSSVAEIIAEKRGISSRQVRKIVAAGRLIRREEAEQLRLAPRKITIKDLQDIGKISDAVERQRVVEIFSDGQAKCIAAARQRYTADERGIQAPVKSAEDQQYLALLAAFSRASKTALRRFVADQFDALSPLVVDEAEKRDAPELAQLRRGMAAK